MAPVKIPQNGKFSQPNNSDLFGNIHYTKNVNFDEEGYVKLSSRMVAVKSEKDDADLGLPVSFGRTNTEFHVATTDQPWDLSVFDSDFSIVEDVNASVPSGSTNSWGRWFNNRWHISEQTKIWYSTGGAWTDTAVSLTTGKIHPMEVFVDKNGLAVGNGNTVLLLSTAYATDVTLTIPAQLSVCGLSYNNGKMAVATRQAVTVSGQNNEAQFFLWNGVDTSAPAGLGVGSDSILAVAPYQTTWVILTRAGELKLFNGGGFTTLATLPYFYIQATLGDSTNVDMRGDAMSVEGDVIYINFGNPLSQFGDKQEEYLYNLPAGILCYDPKVGLYHRYSPSISLAYQISVAEADVDETTDIFTTANAIPPTGAFIKPILANTIGGMTTFKIYNIIKHTDTTFSIAETYQDAIDGNKVDITSADIVRFMAVDFVDYGASYYEDSGGIVQVDDLTQVADHLIVGSDLQDYASSTKYNNISITTPGFENRGYIVSAKINSQQIRDLAQKIYIKYRPLKDIDSIVVKIKDKDILGIPTSTPQATGTIPTWTGTNVFTTTADLSDVKTYLDADTTNECEVEIISGAGAGQMEQITDISELNGTYTITLENDVIGASNGRVCNILINNWKKLGEITSADTEGWKEFPVDIPSKWFKYKVELRGVKTTIEEILPLSATEIPSA